MRNAAPIIVLGAGPAGIGAGLALGDDAVVLESGAEPGGLCRTIELDGAVFDLGGHSFHTPHPEIRELVFQELDMYSQPRQARCYTHGVLIPYPFQAHFREVPDADLVRQCLDGLGSADGGMDAGHFEEYLERRFGAGIARHFLLPYNRKLWGPDLRRLAASWAAERVAAPLGRSEHFRQDGGRRKPLREETMVAYPARGGFAEIMSALARRLPDLRLREKVVCIDPLRKELLTAGGDVFRWRRLVSTLAIPDLLAMLADVPPPISRLAETLEALPMALVLVVVGHPVDTAVQRVYCAGPEIPAHKVVINHNSSPYLRALPHHGIQAEVALPGSGASCDNELTAQVVHGLCVLGLIRSPADVRATRVIHVRRGYPVPTHGRAAAMERLRDWLSERDIDTVGRFAEWAYINSDEALYRGLALGRHLASLN
jgi:UDP-galactopyranose mutase